ncbi:putative transporter small subunit [Agaricicola taiwanensis]|nr:putative transporter small subunit [Agaricicola taiwanensis]
MSPLFLTVYVLIWPLLVAGVLFALASAFIREWRQAKSEGSSLV